MAFLKPRAGDRPNRYCDFRKAPGRADQGRALARSVPLAAGSAPRASAVRPTRDTRGRARRRSRAPRARWRGVAGCRGRAAPRRACRRCRSHMDAAGRRIAGRAWPGHGRIPDRPAAQVECDQRNDEQIRGATPPHGARQPGRGAVSAWTSGIAARLEAATASQASVGIRPTLTWHGEVLQR